MEDGLTKQSLLSVPRKTSQNLQIFKTGLLDKTTKAGKVYEYIYKFLKKSFRFKNDFKNI